ncbi:ribose-phosphate diphosphokinase [Candidatus Pacearchaeota archaeon]|nr:ribose-phosphate diphosphokinase [Candidatus Pacearchaeota archaeon]
MEERCIILAERQGNAWNFAYSVYEKLKNKEDNIVLGEIEIKRFNDGEIKPKIKENVRKANCFFIHDSSKPAAEWFLELALINEAMRNSSAKEITDVLPYFRFARQDRKDESRTSINAKVVANMIDLYANRVITSELHSPQIQGFFKNPADNLYAFPVVIDYLKEKHPEVLENIVIASPDAGGAVRARAFASRLEIEEIVVGYKVRKTAGEVAEFRLLGDVSGKNVLIVDDIIDSGKTLISAANRIELDGGKQVYTYCTHGIFSGDAREKLTSCFDNVFVSDTIPQPVYSGIEVISLVDLFAEAIYRVNNGEPLSQLFE